jgi:GTP-binding protein
MDDGEQTFELIAGGCPGKGNYKRGYATQGQAPEGQDIILDYRIPNDVAILGFPNSGKTSLFNKLTAKTYKVADYPFTTTSCVWGYVDYNFKRFSIMDMPALGFHHPQRKAFENKFLKHLYRSKIILLLTDAGQQYERQIDLMKRQIRVFDSSFLKEKKLFYLLTKVDKINVNAGSGYVKVSAKDNINIDKLKMLIMEELSKTKN